MGLCMGGLTPSAVRLNISPENAIEQPNEEAKRLKWLESLQVSNLSVKLNGYWIMNFGYENLRA